MAFAERPGRRTRQGRVSFDPDTRRWRATLAAHDLHYRSETGGWLPVAEDWQADGAEGFARQAERARFRSRVRDDGSYRIAPRRNRTDQHVSVTDMQVFRQGAWQDVPVVTPTVQGNRMEWVRGGGDLVVRCDTSWRRMKWGYRLNAAVTQRFRWTYTLAGGLALTADGALTDGLGGAELGRFDPPVAWDAAWTGSPAPENVPVTQTITPADATTGTLEYALDLSAAVYPVTLDPTFTAGRGSNEAEDTELFQVNATTNYGGVDTYYISNWGSEDRTILIKFDVSTIPAGATVVSATLDFVNAGVSDGVTATGGVYRLLVAWDEAQATWTNRLTGTAWSTAGAQGSGTDRAATATDTFPFGPGQAAPSLDVAADVQAWVDGTATNHGWVLGWASGGSNLDYQRFYSSEHATAANRPLLTVDYTVSSQTAVPAADHTDGGWTNDAGSTTNLYASIDESPASDADYIRSGLSPSADLCKVTLEPLGDPAVGTGHVVRYRYRKDTAAGDQVDLTVRLYRADGTTVVASQTHTDIPATETDGSFTLTGTEADSIPSADYASGLVLGFEATTP